MTTKPSRAPQPTPRIPFTNEAIRELAQADKAAVATCWLRTSRTSSCASPRTAPRPSISTAARPAPTGQLFTTTGNRPFNDFSRLKAKLDALSGVSDWKLHDLRRTCRTGLGSLGVARETSERVIGHTLGVLDEVYDRGSYREQKLDALARWEARLLAIVGETPPERELRLVAA